MANKLFAEFPPVSTQEWEEVIIKDLKGADYEKKLVWRTLEGFNVRPYYRQENLEGLKVTGGKPGEFPFIRGTKKCNNWLVRQDYCACDGNFAKANREALDGLMKGVESVGFCIDGKKGLDEAEMATLLNGIQLSACEVNFCECCCGTPKTIRSFLAFAEKQGVAPDQIKASFDFNPLHCLTTKGNFCDDKVFERAKECIELVAGYPRIRVIGVEAYDFNQAGSSICQELAFALAQGNEYMAQLTELGVPATEVAKRIKFTFSVGSVYFMEIAKFRAARALWANVVDAYGVEGCPSKMNIHAVTSQWNQTVYDSYVNMLRGTTEAMSAAIAGVNSLEVLPFDYSFREPNEFSNRIARNAQIILKEEAHFDKVVDPAAGSYYIENLTQSIMDTAWAMFKDVEQKGGYTEAFKAGFIQSEIKAVADKRDKNIATRRETILGTNQYPNFLEKAGDGITAEIVKRGAQKRCCCGEQVAQPLEAYRGAQAFEALRFATDRSGKQPVAFMATFGNLAMCRARAQFACNFFAVAGFKVIDNNRFASAEEGAKAALEAGADIVVACSSDDEYAEGAAAINAVVGDKAIVVVAGDPVCRPELEAKGIANYIHVKCNILETLKEYQAKLGIKEI